MTEVNHYKIRCLTDNRWEYVWNTIEPTTCPINNGHTIDPNYTSVVDTITENETKIKEESTPTGGHYQESSRKLNIGTTGSVQIFDFSLPIPVSILNTYFTINEDHKGDCIEFDVAPDTIIGAITQDVLVGDTVINVSPTVIDNIKVGYYLNLFNGPETNYCDRVISIDKDNYRVTVETPTTSFFAAATPTYVRMTIKMATEIHLEEPITYSFGSTKIGATYVPANTVVRICYRNHSGTEKILVINSEYLY